MTHAWYSDEMEKRGFPLFECHLISSGSSVFTNIFRDDTGSPTWVWPDAVFIGIAKISRRLGTLDDGKPDRLVDEKWVEMRQKTDAVRDITNVDELNVPLGQLTVTDGRTAADAAK